MKTYRELEVWKSSMDLVEQVYAVTQNFPDKERFGLTSQLQRAGVSVSANIAEGYGRAHKNEYLHHLSMAYGSLMEVETHLMIAVRLKYVDRDSVREVWKLCQQSGKMLNKLRSSLKALTDNQKP